MRWHRLLAPERILLELRTTPGDPEDETPRDRQERKESILAELVELLDTSGKISNPSKLLTDLRNRERKATTGIGQGLAVPHVRTRQATEFIMALARSTDGLEFEAVDGQRVHLFIAMVSPPYEDRAYLRMYQKIGRMFMEEGLLERILAAADAHDIIRVLEEVSGSA